MTTTFLKAGLSLLAAVTMAACSGSPNSPTAPTAAEGGSTTAAADGSTLKASAPALGSPINGAVIDSRRPTFEWGESRGAFANLELSYELQVMDGGNLVHGVILSETSHQPAVDADADREYTWRVRARLDNTFGPWSAVGTFRTPARAIAVASSVPFAIPPSCGPIPNPPGNRLQCALDVARMSPEWGRCQGGSGISCHRYTRHLAAALASGDPNWGLIGKNPGEQQCTLARCGSLGGEGYGEDVVAYRTGPNVGNNWLGFDVVTGAGAPGAQAGWSGPLSRRPGNYWTPVP